MKNKRNLILAAAALTVGAMSSSSMAASIGVNFIGGNNGGGASVTGTAGLVPQANWNNADTNANSVGLAVNLDNGTASGATLTWNSPNVWATGQAGANQNGVLMQGYIDNAPGQDSTATLTNLPASISGAPYSVIIYTAGDTSGDNRGGNYTVNGIVQNALELGAAGNGVFVPASGLTPGNFLLFTGITGSTLSIDVSPTSGGTPRAPFDGFQVISGTVPEPATVGLLGLGSVVLFARRRRNV